MTGRTNAPEAAATTTTDPFDAIVVRLGGIAKSMEPLSANANKAWKTAMGKRIGKEVAALKSRGEQDWAQLLALTADATDIQIELLVAYDKEGRLGGAKWIGENASEREIYRALKAVIAEAFPFLADAQQFPTLLAQLLPALGISGNGPTPTGGDAPVES